MQIFRQSIINTQCDRCKRVLSLSKMSVCTHCKQILCDACFHGSFTQKLRVTLFGAPAVCTKCRG